jgi:predicted phage tail protein
MLHEKILRLSIAAVLEGRIDDVKIKCNNKQKEILERAISSTKELQFVLEDDSSTLDQVNEAMLNYRSACNMFEAAFNISWPI